MLNYSSMLSLSLNQAKNILTRAMSHVTGGNI